VQTDTASRFLARGQSVVAGSGLPGVHAPAGGDSHAHQETPGQRGERCV